MAASASSPSSSATTREAARRRLTLAAFAYFLTVGLAIPTVPRYLTGPLSASSVEVGLAVATFSVAAIAARPAVLPAARRVSPGRLLAAGVAAEALATGGMVVADSLGAVLVLRAIAGVGDAFFYVVASVSVYRLSPAHRRAGAQARFSGVVSAGLLAGPLVAETVRPEVGYAGTWLLGVAACAVALLAVARVPLRRDPPAPRSPRRIEPGALVPGLVVAAATWGSSAFSIFVALYATRLGLDSATAPFAIVAVVMLATRIAAARQFDRWNPRWLALIAMLLAAVGLCLLAVPSRATLMAGSVFAGLSQALAYPALMQLAVANSHPRRRTAAVATFTGFFEVGLATAAISLGAARDLLGFTGMFVAAAGVSLAGAALLPARAPCHRKESNLQPSD